MRKFFSNLFLRRFFAAPKPSETLEPSSKFPLETIVKVIKSSSAFRDRVNWKKIDRLLVKKIRKAKTDQEKGEILIWLLEQMGDFRSGMLWQGLRYSYNPEMDEPTWAKAAYFLKKEQSVVNKPDSFMISDEIGYLLLPAISTLSADEIPGRARAILDKVRDLEKHNPKAWMIDLRLNLGGALGAMLLGLYPLLGDGVVGGNKSPGKTDNSEWFVLKKDGLYVREKSGERPWASIDLSSVQPSPKIPVVLLLSPATRDEGSAIALAFKGRENTRFVGEPTLKGYTSKTVAIGLPEGGILALADSFMTDRFGNLYDSNVTPDELVEGGDDYKNLSKDKKVIAAARWIYKLIEG